MNLGGWGEQTFSLQQEFNNFLDKGKFHGLLIVRRREFMVVMPIKE